MPRTVQTPIIVQLYQFSPKISRNRQLSTPSVQTSGAAGTRNVRGALGCVRRRISTPMQTAQNAINVLETRGRGSDTQLNMWNAESMFDVARLLGDCLREVKTRDGPYLVQNNIDAHANFIVGGQVRGEPPRLFNVYGEGNFIEATPDTCYFQIGETKYGKPIIDRVMSRTTSLLDATKCTMVSFDSTMRSNISVGLPIDLLVYETDSLRIKLQRRIDEVDPYFQMVHTQWGEGLRRVFAQLPDPDWT